MNCSSSLNEGNLTPTVFGYLILAQIFFAILCSVLVSNEKIYHTLKIVFDVIYQTGETVFHRDIQTPKRQLKIRRVAEYF